MREAEFSRRDVALKFGLSPTRIDQILQEAEDAKLLLQQSTILLEKIRQADDLEQKWNTTDLVKSLGFPKRAINALLRYYQERDIQQVCLQSLMTLAISAERPSSQNQLDCPLLAVKHIGKYGFRSVISRLTELNLGERCNQEWRRRLETLPDCWPQQMPKVFKYNFSRCRRRST